MRKLVSRGYITEGLILILTSFFAVPKVKYDIHMVFDATVSGINNYICAPNFTFPSMGSLFMMVGPETHMVELYVGEIFYNFRLSLMLAKYCGVYLGFYMGHKKDCQETPLWMCWVQLMMGLVLYPYASIQGLLWVSEVLRGDRSYPDNPFR